jgi:two-component system sensor histidine kinase UhpB
MPSTSDAPAKSGPAGGWSSASYLALKIALTYAVIAGAWIFLSGYLVNTLFSEPGMRAELESAKGLLFVLVTALLLGFSLRRYFGRIHRMNCLYAALSHVNEAIVRAQTRETLFDEVTRVLVEHGQFKMAWIGWHDPGTRAVEVLAQCGDDTGYLEGIPVYADERPEGLGPTGTAIREGRAYICNDFHKDPRTQPWRAAALRARWQASAALPITMEGRVAGALTVYSIEPHFFGEREIALLEETALDISFALENLRKDVERRQAEDALKESALRLQMAAQAGNVGLWDWDLRTDAVYFSPEWKRQLGYGAEEIRNEFREWQTRVHPEDLESSLAAINQFIRAPWPDYHLEFRLRHKDGSYRWILAQASLVYDDQGNCVRMLGSHVDVTERRESEEMLHRLSAHLLRAQDLERRRVSRELHDTTAQHLAALSLNLSQLHRLLGPDAPRAEALLKDSIALVKQAAQEIRTQSYLLHPPLLETMGLAAAIEDYAQGFAARSGIRVTVRPAPDFGRLPEEMELALLRVVQESLANVLRHSGSSEAEIVFSRRVDAAILEVHDRGGGIPADMLANMRGMKGGSGVGVGGMQERLRLLGGSLEIESGPAGTTVRAVVPASDKAPGVGPVGETPSEQER